MKVCVLSSGSKGNSTLITTKETKILIDLGTTSSYVEKALLEHNINPNEIDAIFVSHIHSDHIKGLKVFIKRYKPVIYVTEKLLELLKNEIGEFNYKLYENKCAVIKDITVNIIKTSHDAGESVGFIVENKNESIVHITDTGFINSKYHKILSNRNLYVLESNHDIKMLREGPYPYHLQQRVMGDKGHLSNDQASNYLCKFIGNNTKTIVLAHLSEKNNTPEKAVETLNEHLKDNNIKFDNIIVAKQNEATKVIEV
jgi:phosphoribosyl 1,2-cyclic phosphodiesterase